jgi:hypothetical protein
MIRSVRIREPPRGAMILDAPQQELQRVFDVSFALGVDDVSLDAAQAKRIRSGVMTSPPAGLTIARMPSSATRRCRLLSPNRKVAPAPFIRCVAHRLFCPVLQPRHEGAVKFETRAAAGLEEPAHIFECFGSFR